MTTIQQAYILHVTHCKKVGCEPTRWDVYEREYSAVASVESVEPPEPPSARWERRNYSLTQFSGEGIHRRVKKGRVEEDPT
jgi:hypothetical protein